MDPHRALKKYFGFDSFKTFGGELLQEKAVKAAINNKTLPSIFPTGGETSLAFQAPALMSGENVKGLTVVISPLELARKAGWIVPPILFIFLDMIKIVPFLFFSALPIVSDSRTPGPAAETR